MERCELSHWGPHSPDRLWTGLLYRDLVSTEGTGQSSHKEGAGLLLRFQITTWGAALSLHTARCQVELNVV